MGRPLDGVRVLDLTWAQQGPYATVVLSDMGAEIIKVEPRQGELGRHILPGDFRQPAPYFVAHDRGKRSVAIDIRRPEGREVVLRMARRVDVLVHNMRPGVMERLGLGYEDVCAVNPRIVVAGASAFGPLGPMAELPGFDIVAQAMGGLMSKTGPEGAPPMPAGAAVGDQVGALYLCAGILGGLVQVGRTGKGVQVDVSLYGGQIGLQSWEITEQSLLGAESQRAGTGHPIVSALSLWGAYAASDGGFVLGGMSGEHFRSLCQAAGIPELAERYPTDLERAQNIGVIKEALQPVLREKPLAYWLEVLRGMGVIVAPVQTYADVLSDPQAHVNGYVTEMEIPAYGRAKIAGCPIQFDRQPTVPQGPPPELGNCTEVYLEELGYSWEEIDALRTAEVI